MRSERKLIKKILYIISGLKEKEPELTDIEFVYDNGQHVGFKIQITVKEKVRLKLIKKDDKD
jgi:hypothetical protein